MKPLEQRICIDCSEPKPLQSSYPFNKDGTQSNVCKTCYTIAKEKEARRGNVAYLFNKSRCDDHLIDLELKKELNHLKYVKL